MRRLEKRLLAKNESAYETTKWIQQTFGITYHQDHIYRIIRQLGITAEERGNGNSSGNV